MTFSVIIPVWHTKIDQLNQCISSVLQQSFKDFEVLIILDGHDNELQHTWLQQNIHDARVRVIEKEHAGVAAARNKGIDLARGVFLFFLDSDDWFTPGLLSVAAEELAKTHADMLIFNYSCVIYSESEKIAVRPNFLFQQPFVKIGIEKDKLCFGNICKVLVPDLNKGLMMGIGNCANRCYRREMLEQGHIRQDTSCTISEDLLFNISATAQADSVAYIPFMGYNYRLNNGSATSQYDPTVFSRVFPYFEGIRTALERIPEEFFDREKVANTVIVNSYTRSAEQLVYTTGQDQKRAVLNQMRKWAEQEPYASAIRKSNAAYFTKEQNMARVFLKTKQYGLLYMLIRVKQRRQRG